MRLTITCLIIATLIATTPGVNFAFTPDDSGTFEARITTGGTPQVVTPFTAQLRNVSNDATATTVTWSPAPNPGSDDWKSAAQYIDVEGFASFASWGIQIYTDNANAVSATYRYTGTDNPVGLVYAGDTTRTLPMCWRVSADANFTPGTELTITQKYIAADDIYVLLRVPGDYSSDTSYFAPWFWMLDKGTPDIDPITAGDQPFVDYTESATLAGSSGVQIAPTDYTPIPTPTSHYYVYLGAKFLNAVATANYGTDTITLEMYHL